METFYLDDEKDRKAYEKILTKKNNGELTIMSIKNYKVRESSKYVSQGDVTENTKDRMLYVVEYEEEKL